MLYHHFVCLWAEACTSLSVLVTLLEEGEQERFLSKLEACRYKTA